MNTKHVVILVFDGLPLSQRLILESKTLTEMLFRVDIIVWDRTKYKQVVDEQYWQSEVCIHSIPCSSKRKKILQVIELIRFYQRALKIMSRINPDVVHCTHLCLLPLSVIYSKLNLNTKVVIYDVYERHSDDIASSFPTFLKLFAKNILEFLENNLIKHVKGVVTVDSPSDYLEKRYKKFCPNTAVLWNVPDITPEIDQNKLAKLRQEYRGFYILAYVGGLRENKGLFRILDIFNALLNKYSNIRLFLIGWFLSEQEKNKFYQIARQKNLLQNILIKENVSYYDTLCYLSISNVGLALPLSIPKFRLVSAGTGRKFFTYMHAGIPIVATNFAEVASIVIKEKCGITVDVEDDNSILKAVLYLLENPAIAKDMGERGRQAILQRYNWGVEKKKLIAVYNNAIFDNVAR